MWKHVARAINVFVNIDDTIEKSTIGSNENERGHGTVS